MSVLKTPLHSLLTGCALLCVSLTATAALAAPPLLIDGRLNTAAGGPVADGTYQLSLSLYDTATGGKSLASESFDNVLVQNGSFSLAWAVTATAVEPKGTWVEVRVGKDPPLARRPLGVAPFAMWSEHAALADKAKAADSAKQADTAKTAETALSAKTADAAQTAKTAESAKIALNAKTAETAKSAEVANGLSCTGCVTVSALKFDGDVDLGGKNLQGVGTLVAAQFVGDGSKLTGLPLPKGDCPKGQVVTGVAADGSLKCGVVEAKLPADGLAAVSNGLLTNVFDHDFKIDKPVPIPDGSLNGVKSTIAVPDVGVVKSLKVHVELSNSDVSGVKVTLTPPDGKAVVLYDKGKSGKALKATWPTPEKVLSGSLDGWIGENAKGTWGLEVFDLKPGGGGTDGVIKQFRVELTVLSKSRVQINGSVAVAGDVSIGGTTHRALQVCKVDGGPCIGRYVGSLGLITSDATPVSNISFFYVPNSLPLTGGNASFVKMFGGCAGEGAAAAGPSGTTYYDGKGCSGTAWANHGTVAYHAESRAVCRKKYYNGKRCSKRNSSGCHNMDCKPTAGYVNIITFQGSGKQDYELR